MVSPEVIEIIDSFVRAIRAKGISVEKVMIYGSYARGTAREDSDIDLAVISPDFGRDRSDENVLLRQIAWRVDARIEPIAFSPDAYFHGDSNPLVYEIKTFGKPIEFAA